MATLTLDDGIVTTAFCTKLRIADARQHVGDGITHAHVYLLLVPLRRITSWPWSRRECRP